MSSIPNKGPQLVAVSTAFICITILSVGIRIFTRLRLVKWIGADDVLIICSALSSIVMYAGTVIACKYGMGRHIKDMPTQWLEPYVKADLTASLAYSTSAMFVKLSLLAFYLRLSPNRTFRILTYVLIFILATFGVSSILAAGLQCVPISMLWDATQPGHCININAFYFANAGLHILTDPDLCPTNAHFVETASSIEAEAWVMWLDGTWLIVISCYRIATLRDLLGSPDITWNVITPLMWYTIELNLAIFIACGPVFLAFFRHYLPSVFGGSSNRNGYNPSHPKNSYPLGSVPHTATHIEKGTKTTITTRSPYFEENSSEEMIFQDKGIKKQVDVWVERGDLETGKSDQR